MKNEEADASSFQRVKKVVIPISSAHSSALRAGFRRLRYAHACGRSGLGDPPVKRNIFDRETQVSLNFGGSPHQSADWFAMTNVFLTISYLTS